MGSTKVSLPRYPNCDLCGSAGATVQAKYDGKTTMGPWAYMCEKHFKKYGVGLGLGKGQELIVEEKK